jgi:3'(2'), 5'-bisphosphate nucleotidase
MLDELIRLAIAAGNVIEEVYNSSDFDLETKHDNSPLTKADKLSHRVICEGLDRLDKCPILSEEGESTTWGERKLWTRYWLVDPLDGTKEFIKRNGEFTVNIALIENGQPSLGVVYAPVKKLMYFGGKKFGAYQQHNHASEPTPITVTPVPDSRAWKIVGSRSHQSDGLDGFLQRFPKYEMVSMGSSLKICMVADGSADLYPRLGLTSEWDTAAAQAVVEGAGGLVLNWETLAPLTYNTKESLLNPYFIVCAEASKTWLPEA